VIEGHVIKLGQAQCILVIADDESKLAGQLSNLVAIEQVDQAMMITGNKYCDRRPLLLHEHPPGETISGRQRCKDAGKALLIEIEAGQRPLNTDEEQPQLCILVLIRVQNIPAMLKQEPSNHKHQTFAILTIQQQCGAVFHGLSLRILARILPNWGRPPILGFIPATNCRVDTAGLPLKLVAGHNDSLLSSRPEFRWTWATHSKSGGRGLIFDRSEAQWRDLRLLFP
jgi:hypothetical protein